MADTQDWPLQYLLDELRLAATQPVSDDAAYAILGGLTWTGLVDTNEDWSHYLLTPAGSALLELLEVEACKRRIVAAGCSYDDSVQVERQTNRGWVRAVCDDWKAAAEYAEAHAQEASDADTRD